MLIINKIPFSKAFKIVLASVIFAVSLVLSIMLPMNSEKFDHTAIVELTFLSAFGAVIAFSELLCITTGFGRVKFTIISAAADIVMLAVRTFMDWFTNIELTTENGRYIFAACLKNNIAIYILALVAVIALGFIVHRPQKAGSAV